MNIDRINTEVSRVNADVIKMQLTKIAANQNSKRTDYARRKDVEDFLTFCTIHNVTPDKRSFMAFYLPYVSSKFKYSTFERRSVYVALWLRQNGFEFSQREQDQLRALRKGAKNISYQENPKKQAPALSKSTLFAVIENMGTDVLAIRDKAIILTTFWGCFRISEVLNLQVSDLEFTAKGITITLRTSKNHQNETTYKFIPYSGKNCPVLAISQYLKVSGITKGLLFQTQRLKGNYKEKYRVWSGKPLNPQYIDNILKRITGNNSFSTHSLRAGFITESAERGADVLSIMKQSGHKSPDQVLGYIRSKDIAKNNSVNLLID